MTAGPGARVRSVVVVLGMHRSGTSLAAKAVEVLGVGLGDTLWGPRGEDNPTGYWEDRDVVDLNERLLGRVGSAWKSLATPDEAVWSAPALDDLRREAAVLLEARLARYGGAWGFKDPRTARALPFWKSAFGALGIEASYVLTVRSPVDVAASLTRRDDLPALQSHVLWLEHMHGALSGTAGERRCIVDYDALVEQPEAQLRRMAGALGLEVTNAVASAITDFAAGFVSGELRHNRAAIRVIAGDAPALPAALELYGLARAIALGNGDGRALVEAVSKLGTALREWRPFCGLIDQCQADLAALKTELANQERPPAGVLHAQVEALRREKAALEDMLREHGAKLQQFYARIASLEQMVRDHGATIVDYNARLTGREAELARIKRHWTWKIARRFMR